MKSLLAGTAFALLAMTVAASAADVSACLITKTDTNPFFVKMREGAEAAAAKNGVKLQSFAGKVDGDHEGQVAAIETCIASGAKGILITPSDTSALVPVIRKARDAGLLVIALDTPLNPIDAADATFATDNFAAGELIGKWAAATLGDKAKDAKIALLDSLASQPTVDVLRNQGFLTGFGIDTKDINVNGDEKDPRIIGNGLTSGTEEGGMNAMESLLAVDSGINLVYAINEAAASGAYEALKANGREDEVMIVTIDGGCPGVMAVAEGAFKATSQQYPLRMAAMGIEAIAQFAADGSIPKPTEGRSFYDTGATLVTDAPVPTVKSIDAKEGLNLCWG